jgi:hypothetical protein
LSEEKGQHFSHIYGVISYLSIFHLFYEILMEYSRSSTELLSDISQAVRLPHFQNIIFHDSCRRFPHLFKDINDWVGRFCQYNIH